MTAQPIRDSEATVGEILPTEDELIDHLIERNPRFQAECAQARQRMYEGHFHSHAEVRAILRESEP